VGNIKLMSKFFLLFTLLIIAALGISLSHSQTSQNEVMLHDLREKGWALSQQMGAVWDFMSSNQDRLDLSAYSDDGEYFGLNCAIAGRSIGQLFTGRSDYVTRYVNFGPRNKSDEPDSFESEALDAFYADGSLTEYCSIADYRGEEVFRYLAPMRVNKNCLECHGEPVGEIDKTGFAREGWLEGEVGGAISIVIPLDAYLEVRRNNVLFDTVFFVSLLLLAVVCFWIALSRLVTGPLRRIEGGFRQIQDGNLDVNLDRTKSSREINEMVDGFNKMSSQLSDIYESLETQVADRTEQLAKANEVLENQRQQRPQVHAPKGRGQPLRLLCGAGQPDSHRCHRQRHRHSKEGPTADFRTLCSGGLVRVPTT
jgi:HAMP domain-containing protein